MRMTKEQILKLMSKLQTLTSQLQDEKGVGLHQAVSDFYYMQKIEELKFLIAKHDDLYEQIAKISEIIDQEYRQIYEQWKKDLRFITSYKKNKTGSIFIH
jgi:uncharacterized membrane protein YgaE (UPF0421/DUF939 family)